MIISETEKDVKSIKNNINDMQMNVDAKAFNILIDKLYSNKEVAIIREICSNAIDAHIVANKIDTPFDIHLPSIDSNKLIIRDYGNGLTADETKKYLGTVFGSGSGVSNNTIGGFGLGSKSPFSMVDSYYIESYNDGYEHKFLFIREKGNIPKFIHIHSKETSEPSGIKFVIDIPEKNNTDWKDIVGGFLTFSKVKANVNCDINILKTYNIFDMFYYVDLSGHRNSVFQKKHYVMMGGVTYPLDTNNCNVNIVRKIATLTKNIKNDSCIVVEFNIGELDVTPNREHLEYTEKTNIAIENKVDYIIKNKYKIQKDIIREYKNNLRKIQFDKICDGKYKFIYKNYMFRVFNNNDLEKYPSLKDMMRTMKINSINSIFPSTRRTPLLRYDTHRYDSSLKRKVIINDSGRSISKIEEMFGENITILKLNSDVKTALKYITSILDIYYGKENYDIELTSNHKFPIKRKPKSDFIPSVGIYNIFGNKITETSRLQEIIKKPIVYIGYDEYNNLNNNGYQYENFKKIFINVMKANNNNTNAENTYYINGTENEYLVLSKQALKNISKVNNNVTHIKELVDIDLIISNYLKNENMKNYFYINNSVYIKDIIETREELKDLVIKRCVELSINQIKKLSYNGDMNVANIVNDAFKANYKYSSNYTKILLKLLAPLKLEDENMKLIITQFYEKLPYNEIVEDLNYETI